MPDMSTDRYPLYVDEKYIAPAASLALRQYSPPGHAWGYGDNGALQTALSLLLAVQVPAVHAQELHHELAREVVAYIPWPGQVRVAVRPDGLGWKCTQILSEPAGPPELRVDSRVICNWLSMYALPVPKPEPRPQHRFAVMGFGIGKAPFLQVFPTAAQPDADDAGPEVTA